MFKFLQRAEATFARGSTDHRPNQNTYWVIEDRFLAGEYPGDGGSPAGRFRLKRYLDVGINTFVDLTQPREMLPYADLIASPFVECVRFPISPTGLPDPQQMRAILDALDGALAAGRKVYLHCQGGAGRTGTVVACWLQQHGRSPGAALRELASLWSTTTLCRRVKRTPSVSAQVNWVKNWQRGWQVVAGGLKKRRLPSRRNSGVKLR